MKVIHCDKKRVDAAILRQELLAASVPLGPETFPLGDTYTTPTSLAVIVAIDVNPTPELIGLVQGIVASHTPPPVPTPAQIKRQQVRKLIESDDSTESIRLRSLIRVLYASLVETRAWNNAMRLHQLDPVNNPLPPPLVNRSWKVAEQAVLAQADKELNEPEIVNIVKGAGE